MIGPGGFGACSPENAWLRSAWCCECVRMTDQQHRWIWTEQGVDAQGLRRTDDKWLRACSSSVECTEPLQLRLPGA